MIAVAWFPLIISGAVILHIAAGYPLLLALRRSPRKSVAKNLNFETTVSVVMAVHNGASMVRRKIDTLLALDYPRHLVDIIVISDGSTDETESIVREFEQFGVRILTVPHGGKAAALNRGLEAAQSDIIFFTDVRQPLDPQCLRQLVANFADPSIGAVTGELHLVGVNPGEQADMDLYWRYEIWARKRHSEIDSIFNTTGCVYAMRRSLALPLPADTLVDDAILPLRAFFRGYRVILDPTAIAYDYPAVQGNEFRRRLRTLAGLWQVHLRMPQLFTSGNRMRYHFLSHKFGRLMFPWAILVFIISTVFLPPSWLRTLLLTGELSWLLLALSDLSVPQNSPFKRLTSPAKTLMVMNVAAIAAVVVFFVPATTLWTKANMQADGAQSRASS